jgi:hypothetical protein
VLHPLVMPEAAHQLTDLVCQLDLVALARHLEKESRVVLDGKTTYSFAFSQDQGIYKRPRPSHARQRQDKLVWVQGARGISSGTHGFSAISLVIFD